MSGRPPSPLPAATAALYPFRGRNFDRGGGIGMHYLDEGNGDPVVFLHGNPWWSFFWRDLLRSSKDQHRCIVPDHVGCGLSDAPPDDAYAYTLETRVADLGGLLDHVGVNGPVTLVMHDWGGMIGMTWAAWNPDRVKRIVLLNTAAFRLPAGKSFPRELWWVRETPLGPLLVKRLNAFVKGAVKRCATRPLSAAAKAGYHFPWKETDRRRVALHFVQDIPLRPGDRAWSLLEETERALGVFRKTPMLLCWGMKDFIFDGSFLAEWERRFPGAEVHRFPDAGHLLLDDAGDAVIPLVRKFLESQP